MPIPNFIEKPIGSVKKVPKKVWVIAIGGGVVIYIYTRHHSNTQAGSNPATDSTGIPLDQASVASSPAGGAGDAGLPAVDLPSYDFSGVPATDVGSEGGLTLQFLASPAADGGTGSDASPGAAIVSNTLGKRMKSSPIKTLADLPYAERKKIHQERAAGEVDRYGRTATERAAARANPGIKAQLRARIDRQRSHKAGGGPPKEVSHTGPKNPPKRVTPAEHTTATKVVEAPKKTPKAKHHKKGRHR